MTSDTLPSPGRPRDAALDASILRAAMELLGESGIHAVTMDAVAQRAGAGKASLYRRWKSKDELLADALTLHSPIDVEVDTGTLRGDRDEGFELREAVHWRRIIQSSPTALSGIGRSSG